MKKIIVALFCMVLFATAVHAGTRWGTVSCGSSGATEVGSPTNRVSLCVWINSTESNGVKFKETSAGISSGATIAPGGSDCTATIFSNVPTAASPLYCQGQGGAVSVQFKEGTKP